MLSTAKTIVVMMTAFSPALAHAASWDDRQTCRYGGSTIEFSTTQTSDAFACETKSQQTGSPTYALWRSRVDADLCNRKLTSLISLMQDSGWRCQEPARVARQAALAPAAAAYQMTVLPRRTD